MCSCPGLSSVSRRKTLLFAAHSLIRVASLQWPWHCRAGGHGQQDEGSDSGPTETGYNILAALSPSWIACLRGSQPYILSHPIEEPKWSRAQGHGSNSGRKPCGPSHEPSKCRPGQELDCTLMGVPDENGQPGPVSWACAAAVRALSSAWWSHKLGEHHEAGPCVTAAPWDGSPGNQVAGTMW